jgi:hypothetical protein
VRLEIAMTPYLKNPRAAVDYRIDWGGRTSIARVDWTVNPEEPGGLAVSEAGIEASTVRATLEGGREGRAYRVPGTALFADGRRASRSIGLRVGARR